MRSDVGVVAIRPKDAVKQHRRIPAHHTPNNTMMHRISSTRFTSSKALLQKHLNRSHFHTFIPTISSFTKQSRLSSLFSQGNNFRLFSSTHFNRDDLFGSNRPQQQQEETQSEPVHFTFHDRDGDMVECTARTGETLSSVALDNHVTLECACGQVMACSTCHVYLPVELYDKLDFPSEDEDDLLDEAPALIEDSSRLACNVKVTKDFEGMVIKVPTEHKNLLE